MKKEMMTMGISAILLLVVFSSGCIDFDGEEKGEEGINVDISISVDKNLVSSGEGINVTVTVKNNMNKDFPYGDYFLALTYVDMDEYNTHGERYIYDHINHSFTESINISSLATYTGSTLWDTADVEQGNYYIMFEILRGTETEYEMSGMVIKKASVMITII